MKFSLKVLFILSLVLTSVRAQEPVSDVLNNKVTIDGTDYYLYKIKPAEGFYSIGKKFGVSKKEIVDANPESAEGLKLNMLLKIPIVEGRNANTEQLKDADKFIYHIVEQGQSVFYIASKYNVELDTIYANNPGSKEVLLLGSEIRIPKTAVKTESSKEKTKDNNNYTYHTVKPKESLFFLQQLYDVPIRDIVKENPGLADGILKVGMELRIPKKETPVLVHEKPKAELLEDDRFFYHKVMPGETIYAISRKYNVPFRDVKESNELDIEQALQPGVILNIPKEKVVEERPEEKSDKYIVHRVEKKSSLDALSTKFGVESEDIKSVNDDIDKWKKLRKGTLVRIPIKKHFAQQEEKAKDLATTIPSKQLLLTDSALIRQALALGCDTIANTDTINISFFLPLFLAKNDTINRIREKTEEGVDTLYESEIKAIYPNAPLFRELLNGALVAINDMKKQGINVEVSVFDTNRDTARIMAILSDPELKKQHIVIGPAFRNCIEPISAFCKENGIKQVLPFQATEGLIDDNNTLFQVNTPGKYHYSEVVDFVANQFKAFNIVVVKQRNYKDERQETFSALLKQRLLKDQLTMKDGEALRYKEIIFERHGQKGLEAVLSKDIPNIIIVPSESNGAINRILPYLYGIKNKGDWNFALLGFPEWQKLTGTEYAFLFNLHTYLYSPFYSDYTSDKTQKFLNAYKHWFGAEPRASYPRPAFLGYDLTYFYLTQYHHYGSNLERCMNYHPVDLLQSDFEFVRGNN